MVLKFKTRTAENNLKKVMIYGKDGTGKSTFAETYCKENNLNPIVIDVDDTNYTSLPILELNFSNDLNTFTEIKNAIKEVKQSEFDTIILDGVTSLLEMLVSDARGMAKYSDRALRFQKILQELLSSGLNVIFIGQADMEVIYSESHQSSKAVIKVNSVVNEKYLCEIDERGNYTHKVVKFRTLKDSPESVVDGEVPETIDDNPLHKICQDIKRQIELDGQLVTKSSMKSKLVKLIKAGEIEQDMRPSLIRYIQKNCPEGLD